MELWNKKAFAKIGNRLGRFLYFNERSFKWEDKGMVFFFGGRGYELRFDGGN